MKITAIGTSSFLIFYFFKLWQNNAVLYNKLKKIKQSSQQMQFWKKKICLEGNIMLYVGVVHKIIEVFKKKKRPKTQIYLNVRHLQLA